MPLPRSRALRGGVEEAERINGKKSGVGEGQDSRCWNKGARELSMRAKAAFRRGFVKLSHFDGQSSSGSSNRHSQMRLRRADAKRLGLSGGCCCSAGCHLQGRRTGNNASAPKNLGLGHTPVQQGDAHTCHKVFFSRFLFSKLILSH